MPFLSELLHRTVYDSRNEAVGKAVDVYVNPGEGFPAVAALGLLRSGQEYLISALDLVRMDHKGIVLSGRLRDLTLYEPQGGDIVEELDTEAGDYVLSTLDTEVAAETLQEIEPERQASALESIEPERAADILEAMDPDEAADVLGDLSAARAADLLSRMDKDEAEDAR